MATIERKGSLVRVEISGEAQIYRSVREAFEAAYDRRLESPEHKAVSKRLCMWTDLEAAGDLPKVVTEAL